MSACKRNAVYGGIIIKYLRIIGIIEADEQEL
jgi:hypothetical protein